MKTLAILLVAISGVLAAEQESSKPKFSQEELETRFKATFNKATMSGRWCSLEEGRLGPEKKDRYTINSVTKVGNDVWLMNARIQYSGKDLTVPVPIQVKWAGDTAVIVVDKFAMPGSTGVYSARVLVHNNTYSGTWNGDDYGGMLYGVITQENAQSKE